MSGLTIEDLRARHAEIAAAREKAQRAAHEEDLGYAYTLGELEQLIKILEERAVDKATE
jgi:hypothetical protein